MLSLKFISMHRTISIFIHYTIITLPPMRILSLIHQSLTLFPINNRFHFVQNSHIKSPTFQHFQFMLKFCDLEVVFGRKSKTFDEFNEQDAGDVKLLAVLIYIGKPSNTILLTPKLESVTEIMMTYLISFLILLITTLLIYLHGLNHWRTKINPIVQHVVVDTSFVAPRLMYWIPTC